MNAISFFMRLPERAAIPWWHKRTYIAQPETRLRLLAQHNAEALPKFVRQSPVAMRYFDLLGGLAWDCFQDRPFQQRWPDALHLASFSAAYLVKLDQHLSSLGHLRQFLADNPALCWVLGFPLECKLPTSRHFSRMLREMPNPPLQALLADTIRQVVVLLLPHFPDFGRTVSLDTKHIIAWVKENNPKAYIEGKRYEKTQQPAGDPDCKLGCKRRHNQRTASKDQPQTPISTPTNNAIPASTVKVGEYYWGYGSGIVAAKAGDWGEIVLAELTQTFDQADVSYFFPLMATVEQRLGSPPPFGALDAAFDAFYVYDYFHQAGGFAAVPFVEKGKVVKRIFNEAGLPLCQANLPMPLKATYWDRSTAIIEYERGQYVCPLLFPNPTGKICPINDEHWVSGGCLTTISTSPGARIRHELPRDSENYKQVYKQRTATERINALAKELGIERPLLRNQCSIANHNTLIYILLNVRALRRIQNRLAKTNSVVLTEGHAG
ncbi:MAG: hypothetical protein ACOYYS_23205 [Chloroflexota bacterium]